jgi:putative DNA methylase
MGYADLSDFFYIWLRRAIGEVFPKEFETILTPKARELAAVRHRFGGDRRKAEDAFVTGFENAFKVLADIQSDEYPLSFFYAYKQKEKKGGGVDVSTGWETALRGLISSGLSIVGTWPFLSESVNTIKKGKASLSTSIVIVCRKRPLDAGTISRSDFRRELRREFPAALRRLEGGSVAPVDLAQASIGPGMAIYSRHSSVIEADGSAMTVRSALQLINEVLDEVRGEEEGDLDSESRFAVTWYEAHGFQEGRYGEADTLAKARNVSVTGVVEAGIAKRVADRVRILKREELPADWNPKADGRLTVWEATQHLIKRLHEGGEEAAASLLAKLGAVGEQARILAYRLYTTSERKGWAEEAQAYNGLVLAWPELEKLSGEGGASKAPNAQSRLFE